MRFVACENIFLTGVTGVVGGRILYEILAYTEANVYCLVRAEDVQKAKRRIADILAIYDPKNSLHSQFESRVTAIIGDITKPKFGLKAEEYYQLVQQIEQVFHVAANVSLIAGYDKLAKINLQGTSEVVEFCLTGHIPMLYTSTYSVVGNKMMKPGFVFRESDLDVGQSFEYQNYELTKMRAEKLIHSAGNRGLKWVIVRLGDVLGDSKTGCYPLTNTTTPGVYYDIIKTIVETRVFYFTKDYFYLTPVDYAATSSLYLAFNPEAYGKTFHIVNPERKYCYDFVNLLVDFGYRVKIIPFQEYVSLLKNNAIQKEGKIYSSSFTKVLLFSYSLIGPEFPPDSVLFYTTVEIDTSNAQNFLSKQGISCPNIDINLISTYLNYCIEQGFIAPPAKQYPLAILKN
jgi:thioester reductase-like protein